MKRSVKFLLIILCICTVLQSFSGFSVSVKAAVAGDVNGDGKLTAADAREILRLSVGADTEDLKNITAADIDKDGNVSAADARLALRLSIGLFPEKAAARSMAQGELIGYTEKNYPIYKKDGMIYIDGVLIVNKTYALPGSYDPQGLLDECEEAFSRMKKDAAAKGLSIYISSGYRSFSSQKSIYNRYVNRDGRALADTYSARPGHSEHQTGLAIDLNTITQSFGNTKEGRWVAEHCHEYGFILRYPKGKSHITGYCFEPWHLRYVGIETATKITESGLCLEEYYGITSEY